MNISDVRQCAPSETAMPPPLFFGSGYGVGMNSLSLYIIEIPIGLVSESFYQVTIRVIHTYLWQTSDYVLHIWSLFPWKQLCTSYRTAAALKWWLERDDCNKSSATAILGSYAASKPQSGRQSEGAALFLSWKRALDAGLARIPSRTERHPKISEKFDVRTRSGHSLTKHPEIVGIGPETENWKERPVIEVSKQNC